MHYTFIDIGTSCFDTSIDVHGLTVNGILVEPLRSAYELLPESETVKKVNAAISDTVGYANLLTLRDFSPSRYIPHDEFAKMHDDNIGLLEHGTFNRDSEFFSTAFLGCSTLRPSFIGYNHYGYETKIEKCKTITFDDLCDLHNVLEVNEIRIDAEGSDHIILNQILNRINNGLLTIHSFIRVEVNEHSSDVKSIMSLIPLFNEIGFTDHKITTRWSDDIILSRLI